MSKLGNISPVKVGMSKEEAKTAVIDFIANNVNEENFFAKKDFPKNKEFSDYNYDKYTYAQSESWYYGKGSNSDRFFGYLYLKNELEQQDKDSKLNNWAVAETKCMYIGKNNEITFTINSAIKSPLKNIFTITTKDIVTFSKNVGDDRPSNLSIPGKALVEDELGFTDTKANANIRNVEDKLCLIDTEYSSFLRTNKNYELVSEKSEKELANYTFTVSLADLGLEEIDPFPFKKFSDLKFGFKKKCKDNSVSNDLITESANFQNSIYTEKVNLTGADEHYNEG